MGIPAIATLHFPYGPPKTFWGSAVRVLFERSPVSTDAAALGRLVAFAALRCWPSQVWYAVYWFCCSVY